MKDYSIADEYKVDIDNSSVLKQINLAKNLFREFISSHHSVSLLDIDSVEKAYDDAKDGGLLDYAGDLRTLIFGSEITTYGVSYISDSCYSECVYCPMKYNSIDVETGKSIKRKTLDLSDFVSDTEAILSQGHTHICFLTGDGYLTAKKPERLIPYLEVLNDMSAIDEVILNITPQSIETFKKWRLALKDKSLQFRVFQETYNPQIYSKKHLKGLKSDYSFRKESQSRAMSAGFDNYGLGILMGLNPLFLEVIEALVNHSYQLTKKYNKVPVRVCLPSANSLISVSNVENQHYVSPKANELVYALTKLALPEVSLVSSERDTPEMVNLLDKYASNRSIDVQPFVGGNILKQNSESVVLKQSSIFTTSLDDTKKSCLERGYDLILKY